MKGKTSGAMTAMMTDIIGDHPFNNPQPGLSP